MMLEYIRYADKAKDIKMAAVESIFAHLFCYKWSLVNDCMELTQLGHRWLTLLENTEGWAMKTITFI